MYVAHVLALHWWREALTHDTLRPAVAVVLLLSAAAMLFAMAWRRVARRGPLETLMHLPWQLMDQTLGGRSVPGTRADSLYAPERVQRIRRNT